MSLALSTLFGLDGNYHFGGIGINFSHNETAFGHVFGHSFFGDVTYSLLSNSAIKLATFGYLHVFIHEMGHALAAKICGVSELQINIYTTTCRGCCSSGETLSSSAAELFYTLGGPVLSTVWEVAKLTAAIALALFLPPPIGLPLGIFLGAGSAFWIFGEVAYACSRSGDWSFLR